MANRVVKTNHRSGTTWETQCQTGLYVIQCATKNTLVDICARALQILTDKLYRCRTTWETQYRTTLHVCNKEYIS